MKAVYTSIFMLALAAQAQCLAQESSILPVGVKAVWDSNAFHESSGASKHRTCINGLWQWQPAEESTESVPSDGWGYFKVPGSWPGVSDYMQTDSQTVLAHPSWQNKKIGQIKSAWYQRDIEVPREWSGNRIGLNTSYVNSLASVYLDGNKVGEIAFPAAELDLTQFIKPGQKHVLSILVVAVPLKGVLMSYVDSAAARTVQGSVNRRGLCGDVFIVASPKAESIDDVRVATSIRKHSVSFVSKLRDLSPSKRYRLRATIVAAGQSHQLTSNTFTATDLQDGRYNFEANWQPLSLWDIHTPQNTFETTVTLIDDADAELDQSFPVRSGFREFWIDGRDFYLNGTRIYLSSVPFDNALISAHAASYSAALETFRRLKTTGINYVYAHNYDCLPGSHLSYDEILRAADDAGMLFGLTQPHFSHYEWKISDADHKNGYADHARFYSDVAGSHPSVVFYSMSHNATGYNEDMNPELIGTDSAPRDKWSQNNVNLALRAEAIVKGVDSSRIIYHHASGDLGTIHNSNFYTNFTPVQELSDWFVHWSRHGVKPAFTCEYGAPFTWDWTMYRGWFNGKREFGSAAVPWEFCFAEWNSQFLGDKAFNISEPEKKNLRWEAEQFRKGGTWHRWDYPYQVGSNAFEDRNEVLAMYMSDNWRAFRTLGLSGNSPWEYEQYWRPKKDVDLSRHEVKVDWDSLQRPGYSADFIDPKFQRMDLTFEQNDWEPTVAGEALIKNNQPVLAHIAGPESEITNKSHNYVAGDSVEKQFVVINNSRLPVVFKASWTTDFQMNSANGSVGIIETGTQIHIPITITIPNELPVGEHSIAAIVDVGGGQPLSDTFKFQVMEPRSSFQSDKQIALYDPKGESLRLLDRLGVRTTKVQPDSDLGKYDLLIIGKQALSTDGPSFDVSRVSDGLRVICFEQNAAVLEKRFGFRVVEYGLRQVFPRLANHHVLGGLPASSLADWQGEATLVPPRLAYESNGNRFNGVGTVKWCGIDVTRAWRCGNRGNVASVLIEKPAQGDFLPILDGGFSLQYGPLMQYREGQGTILFCQMDVCGRSGVEPAADKLAQHIVEYAVNWKPARNRRVVYAGEEAGLDYLKSNGVDATSISSDSKLSNEAILVCGPACAKDLIPLKDEIRKFHEDGGRILALGLSAKEANSFLPVEITTHDAEHINAYFAIQEGVFAGIGPADVHNRDVKKIALVDNNYGVDVVGDGVLAHAKNIAFCQMVPWQFDYKDQYNVKRTFRRSAFTLSRLLGNLGVQQSTPLIDRFNDPVSDSSDEKRWLTGFYRDAPEEMDDPYRFFRW